MVPDPEIPVLSVLDLGIVRHVDVGADGTVEVGITPTYSGCPATPMIKADVLRALPMPASERRAVDVLAPAWSSDWLSEAGRSKLRPTASRRLRKRSRARAHSRMQIPPSPVRVAIRMATDASGSSARRPARRCTAARPASNLSTTSSASD